MSEQTRKAAAEAIAPFFSTQKEMVEVMLATVEALGFEIVDRNAPPYPAMYGGYSGLDVCSGPSSTPAPVTVTDGAPHYTLPPNPPNVG